MVRDREKKLQRRTVEEVEDGRFEDSELRARQKAQELALSTEQAKQRAKTIGSILRSAVSSCRPFTPCRSR